MNTSLNARRRSHDRDALAAGAVVDVLVVGGGATGAGVALDAASRGLSVALVEQHDLAFGTSRWSSKLIHGGLRYLATGDVGLAYESARERAVLMKRTAPHLVRPLPMVVPLTPDVDRRGAFLADTAHRLADLLGWAAGSSPRLLPGSRRLGEAETRRLLPALRRDRVRGGLLHWDGQVEDDARLVIALARTAAGHGARILTHCRVSALDGAGAEVHDQLDGGSFHIRASATVNAAGVWAGRLDGEVRLRPSKGAHLVLAAAALGNPAASMTVPVPGQRGRFVFALPQPDGLVYLGLTDDEVDGAAEPPDVPQVTAEEERFLLDTLSRALDRPLGAGDVLGRFAGLRPLLAGTAGRTADLSRRHSVSRGSTGAWSVVGGKLTTYRSMAKDVVDRLTDRPCRTHRLPLVGATFSPDAPPVPARLVRRYGSEAAEIASIAAADPTLLDPVAPGVPVLGVELVFGVLSEGAATVADLLERRTRLSLVPAWAEAARPAALTALALASATPATPTG
ncbi:MAG: glycerol-3-phosphate dehydrogenase/oxidase [Mycobacteriales bacterium]